ncbi:FMN-dependent NADH-azoreductase [Photobacterium galatheae]|uniref:FMN dependent NADH:quinone oxidoreductase n=1 Tax=Photobacterium galatheae TaxID=1654360 RepID=A0A066RV64_9GAMM|nr:FMN-dependent NADH-azoreductase [Photobacterium galatheae]KDM91263.1 FMN-dependent NADH-azoreductase [Photobacterium galatheae]MCM0150338.1 FMN-dependent NADH-azoreductase [Photobacterium galatheae]
MSKILVLKSSILGGYSQSNALIDHLVNSKADDISTIIERDLVAHPLPILDGELASGLRGSDQLTQRQQETIALSNQLIEEINASDTLIIGAPMYNFSIPTQLKNWFDLIARAGVTFSYTENGPVGLLTNKKVIVVTSRGGMHQGNPTDTMVPYLKTILGFVGMTDVEFVYAEALNMGDEMASKGLNQAKAQIEALAV